MITIQVNGKDYDNFIDISVSRSLDTLTGDFSFTASSTPDQQADFPIKAGDKCTISADGNLIMTGFVEAISGSYDSNSHTLSIQGRDKTSDVVDSTLGGGGFNFNNDTTISLKKITEVVLANNNITDVKVSVNLAIDDFGIGDVVDAKTGQTLFAYLEQYSRKRQVLMVTNEFGDIEYQQSSGIRVKSMALRNLANNDSNNIKSAVWSNDTSRIFNQYICRSQGNMLAYNQSGEPAIDEIVSAKSAAFLDSQARNSRILNILAESASSSAQCSKRAEWQRNMNRTNSFKYTAVLQGHSLDDGNAWELNRLFKIEDVFADLDDQFLLNAITWNQSLGRGSTVSLEFVTNDAYTLTINTPEKTKSRGGSQEHLYNKDPNA